MPVLRVLLGEGQGAVVVEVATPEEAVRVQQAYALAVKRKHGQSPVVPGVTPLLFKNKGLDHLVFKNGHHKGFEAMYAAGDAGVASEDLAKLLGISGVRSLPPTVGAWGKRAASVGLDLKELLEVDRNYSNGQLKTIYRLTPKGREVFRPDAELVRAASGSGQVDW